MEVSMSNPTGMNRVDFLNKKRKIQAEPVGVPRPKHVRWGQIVEYESSSETTMELPGKISELEAELYGGESSSTSSTDHSTITTCGEDKTYPGCLKTGSASVETSSGIDVRHSFQGRSMAISISGESETTFDHELGILSDYADYEELENLLHSSGIDPSDYILSARKWSDDPDGGKTLTIDKEFEQCFSMLML